MSKITEQIDELISSVVENNSVNDDISHINDSKNNIQSLTDCNNNKESILLNIPEDLIRYIFVHCSFKEILLLINQTCREMKRLCDELLQSPNYIYRLYIGISITTSSFHTPFEVIQTKYFNEYKDLLPDNDNTNIGNNRLPITYVLLQLNLNNSNFTSNSEIYQKWLFKYWNNGNIYEIVSDSVHLFNEFITHMQSYYTNNGTRAHALSLNNKIRFLRLTNRVNPQPKNDGNRLCNILGIINKYNGKGIYGLSAGFHVKDVLKQSYISKNFVPFQTGLSDLRLVIFHGCHKMRNNDCFLLNAVFDNLMNAVYMDLSFMIEMRNVSGHNDDDEKKNNDSHCKLRFPPSIEFVNLGYDFEISNKDLECDVVNVCDLKALKLLYIELNPKRISIEFISQFLVNDSLKCIAINLGSLVHENLTVEQSMKLQSIETLWSQKTKKRKSALDVVVITSQSGVHSMFKKLFNNTFVKCKSDVNVRFLSNLSGMQFLFEFIIKNTDNHNYQFRKLWTLYAFARNNFSSLRIS